MYGQKSSYKNLSFEVVSCPLRFHFMIYLAWPWFIYTLKVWLTIKKVIVYPMYTNKFQRYAKNIFLDIFCPKDFHSNTSLSKYFLNKLLCFRYFFTIRVSNKKTLTKKINFNDWSGLHSPEKVCHSLTSRCIILMILWLSIRHHQYV